MSSGPVAATPGPVIASPSGALRGFRFGDAFRFLGIPYAQARRFAPPTAAPEWTGVREALSPGPAPPQPARAAGIFTHGPLPRTSEACHNLNVFTPALDGRAPVLVWVHGGGFAIGHGAASIYDGGTLASEAGIVVVTINYRLGSLGWLGHPDLAAVTGEPQANWGLLDQIAALRWVRESIAAFGGDPDQVTLAGQSAGALSAIDLLVSPSADGLFARMILHSPPLGDLVQPPARAVAWSEALGRAARRDSGAASEDDAPAGDEEDRAGLDLEVLRALDADELVELHERLLAAPEFAGTRGGALPTLDPATIPVSALENPGASPAVDVLVGATADEGSFFFGSPWRPAPPPERIPGIVAHLTGGDPDAVLARARTEAIDAGLPTEPTDLLRRVATEQMVAGPVANWAAARAEAATGTVHRFRFDHPSAGPELGATHTAEVPLLFGSWRDGGAGERLGGQPIPGDQPTTAEVARELVAAWGAFVHGASPGWTPISQAGDGEVGVFGGRRPLSIEPSPVPRLDTPEGRD